MKTQNYFIGSTLLLAAMFATYSCKKDLVLPETPPVPTSVSPADANALQTVLKITGATFIKSGPPGITTVPESPVINDFQPSASVSPGGQLVLPFSYSSNSGFSKCLLQVVGANNGYFEISGSSSVNNTGTIAVPIGIPALVKQGEFSIAYVIVDAQGRYSSIMTTKVVLKDALTCSNGTMAGSEGLTFTSIKMGGKAGLASLQYNTFSVPDRVDIYQGSTWLNGTGTNPGTTVPPQCNCNNPLPGFVGQTGNLNFNYDPSKGETITVVVSGCLGSSTAWNWTMTCPQ